MKRLAILSTHPIQYNAPIFQKLANKSSIELKVFFSKTWEQVKYDPDFQREVEWDIPLSQGYGHQTLDASTNKGKKQLIAAIKVFGPDALLVYGWNFPGHLAIMRVFHGTVPIWFRGDSHLLNDSPQWKSLIRRTFLKWVYSHVDLAFHVGTANKEYYLWSGLKLEQLRLAPHAVDVNYWQINSKIRKRQAAEWKQQLGIPKHHTVVGYAGKLEPLKQIDLIIRSALMCGANNHCVIAGTGPQQSKIIEEFGNNPRVHFLGFVNQSRMPVFYRMLNLLALASYSETWGLCVNEAMACGIPCIVSDRAGCAKDIFIDTNYGKEVSWQNEYEWKTAFQQYLNLEISSIDWSSYQKKFSIEVILQQISASLQTQTDNANTP